MARGKIQIKKIENSTNRQVTYSKRRNGLLKKAHELAVLCDAKVCLIMFSSNDRVHEYTSPNMTMKQLIDQFQHTVGVDIWSTHYERMQEHLKKLKDVNRNLRIQIRQRMGDCLDALSFQDLCKLEQEMHDSVDIIRQRKLKVIKSQITNHNRKMNNHKQVNKTLKHELDIREEYPRYGLVDDEGDFESVITFQNGVPPPIFAQKMQPNHYPACLHSGSSSSQLTTYTLLE